MRIALGSVLEAIAASLAGLANGEAVCAMIVSTAVMYGVLLVVPEPFTKLVAATMTAAMVVYLGVDTLYSLRDGWRRLVARTDAAGTFDELRSAGEQFGKLMGANAARVLVMVAAAAVGSRAGDVAKVLPKLTGTGQALRFVTAESVEVEVEAVQTATIAKSGITLTLAPGAAVASTISTHSGEGNPGPRPSATEARVAESLAGVPGRVLSRINVSNEGWAHVLARHFSGNPAASQFTIESDALRAMLQSREVVGTPVTRVLGTGEAARFIREVSFGSQMIGIDAMSGGAATSIMTVITDIYGNLVTAFPGLLP